MKKIALLGLVLLTSVCLFAGTPDTYVLKVKVQVANVRSEPDLNASVIGQVKMGELIEATNRIESFFEITITDKAGDTVTGYIHSGVVKVVSGGEPAEETKPAVRQERKPVAEEQSQVPTYVGDDRPKRVIIRVGMSMSNVSLSEAMPAGFTKSSRMGFGAGIGYEFGGPNLCFEVGAVYVPGGFKVKGTYEDTPVNVSVAGAGIGASILAKFKLMPGSTPYIFGGAEAGYLLSQKTTIEAAGQTQSSTEMEGINRIAYGLDFGAGYELHLQGMVFLVEAKYYLGLSNQIKDPEEGAYIKPNGFTIGVGIKL